MVFCYSSPNGLLYFKIILLFDDHHTSEKNGKEKKSIPGLYLLENIRDNKMRNVSF